MAESQNPTEGWRKITPKMQKRYVEAYRAPSIDLRLSVAMAEELVYALEERAASCDEVARQMICEHNCLGMISKGDSLREMADKLRQRCKRWHEQDHYGEGESK